MFSFLNRLKRISFLLALLFAVNMLAVNMLAVNSISVAKAKEVIFNDLGGFEWASDAINQLAEAGVLSGTGEGTFEPGTNLTRAQLAAVIGKAFKLPLDENTPPTFEDVKKSDWAFKFIEAAKHYFFTPGAKFNPYDTVTREELVFVFINALNYDTTNANIEEAAEKYAKDWNDVKDQYKPAAALAASFGFVSGNGSGRFHPISIINRAEMAVFIYRALKHSGGIGGGRYSDVKPGDWYYEAIMDLANREIVSGYPDGSFQPDNTVRNKELPGLILRIKGMASFGDPMQNNEVTQYLPEDFVTDFDQIKENALNRQTVAYTLAKLCDLSEISMENISEYLDRFFDKNDINLSYRGYVASAVKADYIKGSYSLNNELLFNPGGTVSRAEMAVLMVNALAVSSKKTGQVFSDVAPADWFYPGVMYLYNKGFVSGYPDGTFRPLKDEQGKDTCITRSELAAFICRIKNIKPDLDPADFDFVDPEFDSEGSALWSKGFVWAAKDYFITDHSLFMPLEKVSREELAYASAKFYEYDESRVDYAAILDRFNDKEDVVERYRPAMAYLVSTGIIRGTAEGNLNARSLVTRAELAVFLARTLQGLDKSLMKDYKDAIESVKAEEDAVGGFSVRSTGTSYTLTLEEDWILTDVLDALVGDGNTLTIDGQNKYIIYKMDENSDLISSTGDLVLMNTTVIPVLKSLCINGILIIDEKITSVFIAKGGDVNGSAILIITTYKQGRMNGLKFIPIENLANVPDRIQLEGEEQLSTTDIDNIKVMVWGNMDGLIPLCNVFSQ